MEIEDCLILIDFETTCEANGRLTRDEMEIIEIGAIKIDKVTGEIFDEFSSFVRPANNPRLSTFCSALTGIRQTDIDSADSFEEVLANWKDWLGHPFWTYASWGEFDRTILERCLLEMGEELIFANHINLKARATSSFGLKKSGLSETLRYLGLGFEGRHHRALDDVLNIAKILPHLSIDDDPGESKLHGEQS